MEGFMSVAVWIRRKEPHADEIKLILQVFLQMKLSVVISWFLEGFVVPLGTVAIIVDFLEIVKRQVVQNTEFIFVHFFSVCKAEQEKGKNECIERQKFTRNRVSKLQGERSTNAENARRTRFFRPAGKKKKTSGLVRQSAWGQRGQAGRTTRRWISPSSLKSWMVATARM